MINLAKKVTSDIKQSKQWLFVGLFNFLILGVAIKSLGILINITPSMPLGFYIRADGPLSRGDIIAFCLAEPYQTIGIQRGNLVKGNICHGADPLIKQILAVPGDDVLLGHEFIQVNGRIYHHPTRYIDSSSRVLIIYPRGDYPHTTGYWVIGNHSVDSWDSRYWGSIQPDQILYKLKPLLIF